MNVLVIAEHNNDEILPATLNAVNAAKQIAHKLKTLTLSK